MSVYNYGSVVFFNVDEGRQAGLLDVARMYSSETHSETRMDGTGSTGLFGITVNRVLPQTLLLSSGRR